MDQARGHDDAGRGSFPDPHPPPPGCSRANLGIFQRALANIPWKEYTAEGGRKYWYHTETKQSVWDMPEAYKAALNASSGPSTPVYVASLPALSPEEARTLC